MVEETLREAIARLEAKGYDDDFQASMAGLRALDAERTYAPEELLVDEVVRFEGMGDPDDCAIVFALRAKDGLKGTYAVPYGAGMDALDAEVVQRLRREVHHVAGP